MRMMRWSMRAQASMSGEKPLLSAMFGSAPRLSSSFTASSCLCATAMHSAVVRIGGSASSARFTPPNWLAALASNLPTTAPDCL